LTLILVGVTGFIAVGGYYYREHLKRLVAEWRQLAEEEVADPAAAKAKDQTTATIAPNAGFPRRVLAISANNYLYANPVSYGPPGHDFHSLVEQLTDALHIAPEQVIELSDGVPAVAPSNEPDRSKKKKTKNTAAPALEPHPPVKSVIEQTATRFLDGCRPQDRILVIFCGHAAVLENGAYLVPLDGEFSNRTSLIPLGWLYERMQKCRARQKVLIVDVCRLEPARGVERPGGGPMDAKLSEMLRHPPNTVQVWASCTKEQNSFELDGNSIFLEKLRESLLSKTLKRSQRPEDSLPLESLTEFVNQATSVLAGGELKAKQTPGLFGHEPSEGTAFDPNEPGSEKQTIPAPTIDGAPADRAEIEAIVREVDVPPLKLVAERPLPRHIALSVPFAASAVSAYSADYGSLAELEKQPEKYPLRVAVLKVVKQLNEEFSPEQAAVSFRESFAGVKSDRIKAEILREQTKPARVLLDLQEAVEELRKAGAHREQEPSKRWQAHYDYVLAQLLARIAYVSEYNLMLGKIRRDELPELTAGVHSGYRLSSQEKMQSGKEIKDIAAESRKILAKLATEHRGTPWEILARRAQVAFLGLRWEPTR
jgi:hypothetical protein